METLGFPNTIPKTENNKNLSYENIWCENDEKRHLIAQIRIVNKP